MCRASRRSRSRCRGGRPGCPSACSSWRPTVEKTCSFAWRPNWRRRSRGGTAIPTWLGRWTDPLPSQEREGGQVRVAVPDIRLNNGVEIPQLGLGVLLLKPEETIEAVGAALRLGYRHIDTAQAY